MDIQVLTTLMEPEARPRLPIIMFWSEKRTVLATSSDARPQNFSNPQIMLLTKKSKLFRLKRSQRDIILMHY